MLPSGPANALESLQIEAFPLIPPYFGVRFSVPADGELVGAGFPVESDAELAEAAVLVCGFRPLKDEPMISSSVPGVRLGSDCSVTSASWAASVLAAGRSDVPEYSMTDAV